ncbi:MAG: 4Fe-4S binding protein [Spirochaetales bacterium]|nr:4Fe-4S binding protein [Spirochaetales bacterium]
MLRLITNRIKQGHQTIRDLRRPGVSDRFRGLPELNAGACPADCAACAAACPTRAIETAPLTLDLGKCVFCGACERACPRGGIVFTSRFRMGTAYRERLVAGEARGLNFYMSRSVRDRGEPRRFFRRSLKLRQVSAGGCAACELELNACSNVNFDMGRYGIEFTASPRHADGLVVTGPITKSMSRALEDAYAAVPEPKIVVLAGACALSGGLYAESDELDRRFLETHRVDLFIPGCPPHPLTFINAVIDFIGRK